MLPATLDATVRLFGSSEAAKLAGVSHRAIQKAIATGRLRAESFSVEEGRRKGRTEYRIQPSDLFCAYPSAREAWESRQVQAAKPPPSTPQFLRDPQTLILRADAQALQRHQEVHRARLDLLEKARAWVLETLTPYQQAQARMKLPNTVRAQALGWLATEQDGQALAVRLGGIPSAATLSRWWQELMKDPTGAALKPRWTSCGRIRKTDADPELVKKIEAAYALTGNFTHASEHLRRLGTALSEATIRRHFKGVDPAILVGLRMGARKAITDHGPYVRRAPSLPFQCWSIDGHTLDALVLWEEPLPGEKLDPFRPQLYMVRDVGSGAILSAQIGHGLNRYLPFMAIAEAILRTGVIPEHIQSDNGGEVKNRLFLGDEDTVGYFNQLGMGWSEGQALWRGALPYNSRSKPIERDFRTFTEGFTSQLPAYVGGNPSARPGDPLNEARKAGHFETVASLKAKVEGWIHAQLQKERTVQRRRILPVRALEEARTRLAEELGPQHLRFVRTGHEWRVLPGLKARLVRGFVVARIEGQELRFHTALLDTLHAEGLEVRIWPWDVTKAWLVRGGELVDTLQFVPDGPALGGAVDVVALRIAKNIERRQRGILRQAKQELERNQRELGLLTGFGKLGVPKDATPLQEVESFSAPELSDAEFLEAQARLREEMQAAPLEDTTDRFIRLFRASKQGPLAPEDAAWFAHYTSTPEGQAALESFGILAN